MTVISMGLDIFVYEKCAKCGTVNHFELYRSEEGEPFNFSKEHWALLEIVEAESIKELREEYSKMTDDEKADNINEMSTFVEADTERKLKPLTDEDFYVAANMKFIDEGAYNFLKCEKCGTLIKFFVVSA
jgi:hypothetical protein